MIRRSLLVLLLATGLSTSVAQEPDHEIHEELRALLHGIEQAINEERYEDLAQYFDPNLRATTINQEVILSPEEIVPYFNRWFGPGGILKKLDMKLTADALTELYCDKTLGVVYGGGEEDYRLSDKRSFDMKTRWTATVIKDDDGRWRVLTIHIGTNFLDNPLLARTEGALMTVGIAGGIVGLLVGGIAGFWIRRRKKT